MKHVGITIKYNKVKHIITLSMPDYITKALKRFGKEHVKRADCCCCCRILIHGSYSCGSSRRSQDVNIVDQRRKQ